MANSPKETIDGIVRKLVSEFKEEIRLLDDSSYEDSQQDGKADYQEFLEYFPKYFILKGEMSNILKSWYKIKLGGKAPEGSEMATTGKRLFVEELLKEYFPVSAADISMEGITNEKFEKDAGLRKNAKEVIKSVKKYEKLVHYVGNLKNMQIEKLWADAEHDPLTEIMLNHRSFHNRLEEETERIEREGGIENSYGNHCIIYIDLDGFKQVNDNLGHNVGDDVIRTVAKIIAEHTRNYDNKGRDGGDEFVIYLPHTTIGQAKEKALQIRKAIATMGSSFARDHDDIGITASIGVAALGNGHESLIDVIRCAENAMYLVKSTDEKNGVEVYNPLDTDKYRDARAKCKGRREGD